MSLELRAASISRQGRYLLQDISMQVLPGQVTAVIGANGAGKTTLMKLLCGDDIPDSGSVLLDGVDLRAMDRKTLAARRAVLPQHAVLDFPFVVFEVIEMGRIPHQTGRLVDRQIVNEVIDRLQLSTLSGRIYTTLSGGERQRVQIARVLVQIWDRLDGCYVLFDEPTAPLDLAHQIGFLGLMQQLGRRGAAIVMVLHDINLASRYADAIALLHEGKLLSHGAPAEVITVAHIRQAFGVEAEIRAPGSGSRPLIDGIMPVSGDG